VALHRAGKLDIDLAQRLTERLAALAQSRAYLG